MANKSEPVRVQTLWNTTAGWAADTVTIPELAEFCCEQISGGATKVKVGDGINTWASLPYIFSGGGGGTGNLQAVLNVGNIADGSGANINEIILKDSSLVIGTHIFPNQINLGQDSVSGDSYANYSNNEIAMGYFGVSGNTLFLFNGAGGVQPSVNMKDIASGFNAKIQPPSTYAYTSSHGVCLPDEGNTSPGIESTIVLHTTKDNINVGLVSGNYCRLGAETGIASHVFAVLNNAGGTVCSFGIPAGAGTPSAVLRFNCNTSLFSISSQAVAGVLTAHRSLNFQDIDGVYCVDQGNNSNQVISTPTTSIVVTHSFINVIKRIMVTPNNTVTGNAMIGYCVQSIGIGTFTIVLQSAFVGNFNVNWQGFSA